jgi:hypothetical protein
MIGRSKESTKNETHKTAVFISVSLALREQPTRASEMSERRDKTQCIRYRESICVFVCCFFSVFTHNKDSQRDSSIIYLYFLPEWALINNNNMKPLYL